MPPTSDSVGGTARRQSFPGVAEGAENAPANRATPTTDRTTANKAAAAGSAARVRWQRLPPSERANDPTNADNEKTHGGNENAAATRLNTSVASSARTPSKRIQDKFVSVASGKKTDAVFAYHFENTPFSHKKRKKDHHHGQQQRHSHQPAATGGMNDAMVANEAMDNTFHMGADATAEILNMHTNPLEESILSVGSKSSMASNASSTASSDMDPMNATTLSDTHELSTSNFVQSTRMRGVLADRAKALFGEAEKRKQEKKQVAEAEQKKKEEAVAEEGEAKGGAETAGGASPVVEATMTLPDLTMTGLLSEMDLPSNLQMQHQPQQPQETQPKDKGPEEGTLDYSDDLSETLEFTSHQRTRTPRKGGDVSLLNNSTATADGDTRSAGGLDTMLSEFGLLNESVGLESNDAKDDSKEDTLSRLIKESQTALDETEEKEEKEKAKGESRRKEASFVESTASGNDLDDLLGGDDDEGKENDDGNKDAQASPVATATAEDNNAHPLSESTPDGPNTSILSAGSPLCPSPSYASGQKLRMGKGLSLMRQSLGGDVSKIRELTASLRKEKRAKGRGRMSLPALAGQRRGGAVVGRRSMGMAGTSSLEQLPASPEPAGSPARKGSSKDAAAASPEKTIESPARNTRSATKSPTRKSPRRSPRKSPVPPADSPARNTRGAKKSPKKSPVPSAESPARNARGAGKRSPKKSPVPPADSPARNTRGAKKRSRVPPPAVESPAARSLFGSPSEIRAFQEINEKLNPSNPTDRTTEESGSATAPFSGRRKRGANGTGPPKKRLSASPEPTELSATSLSKEYPFLSLSPGNDENVGPSATHEASNDGTQTLMFGELMEGIQNEVGAEKASKKDAEEDSGEIAFSSRHSSRKKRRDTADTADLVGVLTDAVSPEATTAASKENGQSPHTPVGTLSKVGKTPKSILSSSKKRHATGGRPRRNVGFGSPVAAEYNVGSPSVSMTPMCANEARERYQVPPEDERTTELEGDLERLVSRGNDTSILLDPIDELGGSRDLSGSSSLSSIQAEQTEELETNMLGLVDNNSGGEETAFSLQSISSVSSASKDHSGEMTSEDMSLEQTRSVQLEGTVAAVLDGRGSEKAAPPTEDSRTMELEGTLGSLLDSRNGAPSEDTQTMELEGTLGSLLQNRSHNGAGGELTLPSLSSTSTPPVRNCEGTRTMNIESTMASLLDVAPDKDATGNLSVESHTVPLDNNMEVLLENAGGRQAVALEDTTISELGMNTASHDTVSELGMNIRAAASRRAQGSDDTVSELGMNTAGHELRTIVESPPEPVDLTLTEVMGREGIDCGPTLDSRGDIFLDALGKASINASSCPSIRPESEGILAQMCEDIESHIGGDDGKALFRALVDENEELMRGLQRNLRSKESPSGALKDQAGHLVEESMEATLVEWDKWVSDVVEVYNGELSKAILPSLQKDKADLSEKSSLIDQNREQIALPMLIRTARRQNKRNFDRTKGETSSCEAEVSELEAQLEEAERQLAAATTMRGKMHEVAELNDKSDALQIDEKEGRRGADSSYFKFFSVEKLHNWVLTGSSDSSIGLAFCGLSSETTIQLLFNISASSDVTLSAKLGSLPRATKFLSAGSKQKVRFHPAVSDFMKNKMKLLFQDLKETLIPSPSEIPTLIHLTELRVARIEEAAKEIDTVLRRCRNSFLQPSDSLENGYDFTAYLSSAGENGDRIQVLLSIPDCYPFGPIGLRLHSKAGNSFDTDSMARQLKKAMRPGFGALTSAVDAAQGMVN